jgi:hypothetical protein
MFQIFKNKSKAKLSLVKPIKPKLTYQAIKDEVLTKIRKIHANKTISYTLSEDIFMIYNKSHDKALPMMIMYENDTGLMVQYSLLILIPDLLERYEL